MPGMPSALVAGSRPIPAPARRPSARRPEGGGDRAYSPVQVRRLPVRAVHVFGTDPGLTTPFARRTPPLTAALVKVALALAGRPGSRLAAELAMPSCRDVLIQLIRAQPLSDAGRIEVLGVDDFAVRRGQGAHGIAAAAACPGRLRAGDCGSDVDADAVSASKARHHERVSQAC